MAQFTVKYDRDFEPSGLATSLAWCGSLKDALHSWCGCESRNERITGIVVDDHGVTVYFAKRIHAAAASKYEE